jgi:hypothetical protein
MIALTASRVIVQLSDILRIAPWPLRNRCTLVSQIMDME